MEPRDGGVGEEGMGRGEEERGEGGGRGVETRGGERRKTNMAKEKLYTLAMRIAVVFQDGAR